MIKFTIAGKPRGQGRPRFNVHDNFVDKRKNKEKSKKRKQFVNVYEQDEDKKYKQTVQWTIRKALGRAIKPTLSPIEISFIIYFPIPKAWPKWKKDGAVDGYIVPTTTPDFDNIEKIICDAMNEFVYHDDAQIVNNNGSIKRYSHNPRVEVCIDSMDLLRHDCSKTELEQLRAKTAHIDTLI